MAYIYLMVEVQGVWAEGEGEGEKKRGKERERENFGTCGKKMYLKSCIRLRIRL